MNRESTRKINNFNLDLHIPSDHTTVNANALEMDAKEKFLEIDITNLKEFACKLPMGSALREVLMAQDSRIRADVFIARLPDWLQLSRLLVQRNLHFDSI
jgi:hypothetical protein